MKDLETDTDQAFIDDIRTRSGGNVALARQLVDIHFDMEEALAERRYQADLLNIGLKELGAMDWTADQIEEYKALAGFLFEDFRRATTEAYVSRGFEPPTFSHLP